MLTKRVIPCLDVHEGRVVKGVKFVNLRDAGDPVELAAAYDKAGADEVVFLDITASHEKRNIMVEVARRCAEQVFIPYTVGGGIRNLEDIRELLKAGADKIAINTAAVKKPELVREASQKFGSQCIVVAIDAKQVKGQGSRVKKKNYRLPTTQYRPAGGRYTSMAEGLQPELTLSSGQKKWKVWERAKYF